MTEDESNLPANRLWQPTTARWFYVIFGGCVAYAVVRYHFAGNVVPLVVKRNLVLEREKRGLVN
jgi:hypothetical protein